MAAVPTLVAGIYGMNFDTMPELRWALGYPLVLIFMAIIVALLYRRFKTQRLALTVPASTVTVAP